MTEPPDPGLPGAVPLPPVDPPAVAPSSPSAATSSPPPPPGVSSAAAPSSPPAATLLPPPPPGVAAARASAAGPSGASATPWPDGDRDAPVGGRARDDRGLMGIAALVVLVVAIVVVNAALLLRGPQRSGPGTAARPAAGMPWRTPAISPKPSTTPRPSRSPRPSPTPRPSGTAAPSTAAPSSTASSPGASPTPATTRPPAATAGPDDPVLRIGLTLPLSAANSADGKGVANAVQLAIDEHPIAGYRVEVVARDYASGGGGADPQKAVWGLDEMATQRQVVGVVGPIDDSVARLEAPETNRAGLLQCSPAVSSAALTQGSQGELLRKANPKRITFVRVSTTVASEGVALARFAYQTLKVRVVGIVAEGDDGTVLADAFTREFTKLGGTTGARWLVQAVGPNKATIREWREIGAGAVLLASDDPEDAQEVATALADAGLRSTALLVGDRVVDVPPDVNARLVEDAGRKLNGIYGALPIVSEAPQLNDFAKRYRGRFGEDPSLHAASGYACAEVVLRAIQAATGRGSVTREAVRAAAVDPRTTHPTIVGPVRFDAVGDLRRRTVSILRVTRDTAWISPWNYTVQVTVAK